MRFWQSGAALTGLSIIVLLLGCELLARAIPSLRRLGVPLSIVAGTLGLLLGEQVVGLFALDVELLELIVYHGLAIVFISVSLHTPAKGGRTSGSVSMAFAICAIMAIQSAVGLGLVLGIDRTMHPGFGLALPMGFEEGPGQALSLGAAWEQGGMPDGAQVGLIVAVIGYAWAVLAGIPLAIVWRRRGAGTVDGAETAGSDASEPSTMTLRPAEPGALDGLTVQVAAIAGCYLLTFAWCSLLTWLLPGLVGVIWGFHFIFGALIGMAVRPLLARLREPPLLDDHLLGRVSGLTVDVITCAALAAVQIHVLRSHWLPIAVVTTAGGVATLAFTLWIARWAWPQAPREHAVLFFGMSTGTLPTGLALLRVIDPDLRTSAATSAVIGSGFAVAGVGPMLMVLVPMTIDAWPDAWPGRGFVMFGVFVGTAVAIVLMWRLLGTWQARRRVGTTGP